MTIHLSALDLSYEDIILSAIDAYNNPCHYLPDDAWERRLANPATIHSDMGFLARIVQNYLRHSCTDYDAQLAALQPSHPDDCMCLDGCYEDPDMVDYDTGECGCPGCSGEICDHECVDPEEVEQIREDIQEEIDDQWLDVLIESSIESLRADSNNDVMRSVGANAPQGDTV